MSPANLGLIGENLGCGNAPIPDSIPGLLAGVTGRAFPR